LNCSNRRRMSFTCGGFLLNSFLNWSWTPTNYFFSADHKTHFASPFSVIIINSVQRRQGQTLRRRHLERALGGDSWCVRNYLSNRIHCCHFPCFIPHESYIIGLQHLVIVLWKPCTTEVWIGPSTVLCSTEAHVIQVYSPCST
jgi:hypothetical protein